MTATTDAASAVWTRLVRSLRGLHELAVERSCHVVVGIDLVVAAAELREVLERLPASAADARRAPTQDRASDLVGTARMCLRELLDPEITRELDAAELLLVARTAHVLARVEDALEPAAS